MNRPVGIETEYGINCEGFESEPDFAFEASALVRNAPITRAFRGWDYRGEDPRLDMRGMRVDALAQDPNDFAGATDRSRSLTREELLANTVLVNGARLYNDHNHPEYCTDVCLNLRELVAQDRAGERVLLAAERVRNSQLAPRKVRLVKNNTDYHGRSYGCHENYLTLRETPVDAVVAAMVPFLVTRIVFTGAGRVGIEGGQPGVLQLSQRADFFEEVLGINTTYRRPIFNTRDEPHADQRRFRRLHVIAGDANRSEWATAMKVGTTALVLDIVETGWRPPFELRDPVRAIHDVSHDLTLGAVIETRDRGHVSALDLQNVYYQAAVCLMGRDPETDWILSEWRQALADLRTSPDKLADRADWAVKRALFAELAVDLGEEWTPELARRVDLGYHLLDPDLSPFPSLVAEGRIRTIATEAEVDRAEHSPPSGTRALVRGAIVRKFAESIESVEWDRVTIRRNGFDLTLRLDELTGPRVDWLAHVTESADSLDAFVAAIAVEGGSHHAAQPH